MGEILNLQIFDQRKTDGWMVNALKYLFCKQIFDGSFDSLTEIHQKCQNFLPSILCES